MIWLEKRQRDSRDQNRRKLQYRLAVDMAGIIMPGRRLIVSSPLCQLKVWGNVCVKDGWKEREGWTCWKETVSLEKRNYITISIIAYACLIHSPSAFLLVVSICVIFFAMNE